LVAAGSHHVSPGRCRHIWRDITADEPWLGIYFEKYSVIAERNPTNLIEICL
jgi:hypothetical protein